MKKLAQKINTGKALLALGTAGALAGLGLYTNHSFERHMQNPPEHVRLSEHIDGIHHAQFVLDTYLQTQERGHFGKIHSFIKSGHAAVNEDYFWDTLTHSVEEAYNRNPSAQTMFNLSQFYDENKEDLDRLAASASEQNKPFAGATLDYLRGMSDATLEMKK